MITIGEAQGCSFNETGELYSSKCYKSKNTLNLNIIDAYIITQSFLQVLILQCHQQDALIYPANQGVPICDSTRASKDVGMLSILCSITGLIKMRSQLAAQFLPFSSAFSMYFKVSRQKVPYFNASRQNRVVFNCFALSGSLWLAVHLSLALSEQ